MSVSAPQTRQWKSTVESAIVSLSSAAINCEAFILDSRVASNRCAYSARTQGGIAKTHHVRNAIAGASVKIVCRHTARQKVKLDRPLPLPLKRPTIECRN